MLRSQQSFKSEMHNLFTKKLSNIALSFHGDKGLQSKE